MKLRELLLQFVEMRYRLGFVRVVCLDEPGFDKEAIGSGGEYADLGDLGDEVDHPFRCNFLLVPLKVGQEAGFIQLTTLLAHLLSGVDVLRLAGLPGLRDGRAAPNGRRPHLCPALFSVRVGGIAGEDDLDAPDLPTLELKGDVGIAPQSAASGRSGNGHASAAATTAIATSRPPRRSSIPLAKPILEADASASLRDQLLGEIAALGSSEQIDDWAHRGLTAKNTLSSADAALVEVAFGEKQTKLSQCEPRTEAIHVQSAPAVDFESLAVNPKPRRLRDKSHRQFVSAQPCLVCARQPSDAHHLRFAQPKALGRKVSDEFTVPVCRTHHRELHRTTKEREWWLQLGIDPLPVADRTLGSAHPHVSAGPDSTAAAGVAA